MSEIHNAFQPSHLFIACKTIDKEFSSVQIYSISLLLPFIELNVLTVDHF